MRRGRSLGLTRALALGVAAMLASSCGLSTDNSPESLAPENIPEELGGTSTSTTSLNAPGGTEVTLWLVGNGDDYSMEDLNEVLVPTQHSVVLTSNQALIVLETLFTYVPDEQAEPGLVNPLLSPGTTINDVRVNDRAAVVDLPSSFYETADPASYGQIVLTLTELPGIGRVQFQADGDEHDVTDANSRVLEGPATADDYAPIQAPSDAAVSQ